MATSKRKVQIFVSYAHLDETVVTEILGYMRKDVEQSGGIFWWDKQLNPGEDWETVILDQINKADIVLAFVSQAFLNSDYITNGAS